MSSSRAEDRAHDEHEAKIAVGRERRRSDELRDQVEDDREGGWIVVNQGQTGHESAGKPAPGTAGRAPG